MGQAEQLDAAIGTLLRILTIDERRLSTGLGTIPFNPLDLETLSYLHRFPNSVAKDVARHLGVRATTMQSVIDRLQKRGLVARNTSVLRGRAVALTLTETGLSFRRQIHAQNIKNCRQMLQCIAEHKQEAFVRDMTTISQKYAEKGS